MSTETGSSLSGSFGYIESTAAWSTRYIDPSGFECLLSIQAETGSEALKKAESAISHLIDAECTPLHKNAPNGNHKGNGHKPGATIMVKTNEKKPTCPLHGVEMQKWSKNGRTWHSHRWNDGWCQGEKS
jgi:hypothetical protein